MRKLIGLIVLVGAVSIVPAVQADPATTVCPPGVTNPAYCTTFTTSAPTGGDATSRAAAKAVTKALDSLLANPTALAQAIKTGVIPISLPAGSPPGTYTITLTDAQGVVIATGSVTIGSTTHAREAAAKTRTFKLKLTKAGKTYLKTHRTVNLKLSVKYKPHHGKTKTSKVNIKN